MSVKDYAISDIKKDLEKNHKCFLAFISKLDPSMDSLVNQQIKEQEQLKH